MTPNPDPSPQKVSDSGLLALARHEGVVPAPYRDVRNIWTFGIGHTAAAGGPDPATLPRGMPVDLDAAISRAFRLFRQDLARSEAEVARAVTVPLAPHEFDALVSFHYNTGAIARATLTARLNAGDRAAAARAFLNWRRPAAIIPRREAERDLFREACYPIGPIPVWGVDATGHLDLSRPARSLSESDALALLRQALALRLAPALRPVVSPSRSVTGIAPPHPNANVAPLSPARRAWLDRVFPALAQLLRRS